MSSGEELNPKRILDEEDEELSLDSNLGEDGSMDPIMEKLMSFDPSTVKQRQLDPTAIELRKARRRKTQEASARLWGLTIANEKSNTKSGETEQHAAELARMQAAIDAERQCHLQDVEQLRLDLTQQRQAAQVVASERDQVRAELATITAKAEAMKAQVAELMQVLAAAKP